MISYYRKKPVRVRAVQLCWKDWSDVCLLLGKVIGEHNPGRGSESFRDSCGEDGPPWIELTIPTPEGDMVARHGDWIIEGFMGEFYPCKPDVFEATYEVSE